jgi:DNA polymerase-3 subunit beta
VEGIHEEISCIIPAKVLEELRVIVGGQAFDEGDGDREAKKTKKKEAKTKEQKLDVSLSSQQIEVHVGPTRLLSRLIDGKFPNYQQILPKDKKTSFMVSTNELLTAVKRMHYFAKETNNNITFSVERGSMTLTTQETQLGKDESIIAVESEGENNKIALSSSYLIDYLSHVASDKLQVELTDHQHPALFRIPEDTRSLHLIMPLRMSGE